MSYMYALIYLIISMVVHGKLNRVVGRYVRIEDGYKQNGVSIQEVFQTL